MSQGLNFQRIFKEFCNVYFTKHLEDDRIPTNIDINGRLNGLRKNIDWKVRSIWNKFKVYIYEQVFIFKNNCEVVNLLNVF